MKTMLWRKEPWGKNKAASEVGYAGGQDLLLHISIGR